MLAVAFTLGALAMSDVAVADDPKPPTKEWKEQVTVKVWVEKQKFFLPTGPDVWARRVETKKGLRFDVRATNGNNTPGKGSVIIDKDGNEYTVIEAEAPPSGLFVKLTKAAPKKKP